MYLEILQRHLGNLYEINPLHKNMLQNEKDTWSKIKKIISTGLYSQTCFFCHYGILKNNEFLSNQSF